MVPIKCSVIECQKDVVARGLCRLHYERLTRKGTLENTRPKDWGAREKHPLYQSWIWMIRSRVPICEEWRNDFWKFVAAVGNRPSEKHRCFRLKESEPYGPLNFFWRETVFAKESSESEKEYRRRYMREYNRLHPERQQNASLKKNFGITLDQYNAMLKEQNGVCAICGEVNDAVDRRTGKARNLSVDHCHKKGHVRKLLCQYCNQGLGNFRDRPDLLRAAAVYLGGSTL